MAEPCNAATVEELLHKVTLVELAICAMRDDHHDVQKYELDALHNLALAAEVQTRTMLDELVKGRG